ncbi:MAG: hypothetical protein MJ150_06810, partial [Clostridia bacterium]|nr:hypothetical protein [Clostridia bacterium]
IENVVKATSDVNESMENISAGMDSTADAIMNQTLQTKEIQDIIDVTHEGADKIVGITKDTQEALAEGTEAIKNLDLIDKAKAITCPVFVIGSKGDKVITGEASVELAEITGGKLYLYGEESSHAIYDEESDLRGMAKDFFDGIDK